MAFFHETTSPRRRRCGRVKVYASREEAAAFFATLRSVQANKGRLMTTGLWALTMHANYFGDTLLFTGWTLASSGLAVSWTWWAVPVMTALFVFMHIPVRAPRPGSPSDDVAAMAYKWDSSVTASPRAGPRRVPRGPLPEGVPQVRRDDGEIRALRLLRRSLPVVRYLVSTPGRCPPPFFGAAAAAAAEPLRAAAEAPRPAAAAAAAAARRRRPL